MQSDPTMCFVTSRSLEDMLDFGRHVVAVREVTTGKMGSDCVTRITFSCGDCVHVLMSLVQVAAEIAKRSSRIEACP